MGLSSSLFLLRPVQPGKMIIKKIFSSLRQYFRQKRYLKIKSIARVESLRGFILDLGGGPASFFAAKFPRPEQVILLEINHNEAYQARQKQPMLHVIIADGECLPIASYSIDMTISNSVIEHVNNPTALAKEIQRVSKRYFLQTPNGDFPLETHSFVAIPFYNFIHWKWLQRLVCRLFGANFEYVNSVRYLPEQRLKSLFLDASISYERVLGFKKSFYVYHFNKDF